LFLTENLIQLFPESTLVVTDCWRPLKRRKKSGFRKSLLLLLSLASSSSLHYHYLIHFSYTAFYLSCHPCHFTDEMGVISALSKPLADIQLPTLYISSYETSYILVPEDRLAEAIACLRAADIPVDECEAGGE
jgi:hypothetical protein